MVVTSTIQYLNCMIYFLEVLGCGTAPIIADGDLKYTRKSNNSHNEMVEYMCQAYYTMEGEPYKTCVNGVWTGHTRCIRKLQVLLLRRDTPGE